MQYQTKQEARQVCKAINRRIKRRGLFQGGRCFGVDYNTWVVTYPQMAKEFCLAAQVFTGRVSRFLPKF